MYIVGIDTKQELVYNSLYQLASRSAMAASNSPSNQPQINVGISMYDYIDRKSLELCNNPLHQASKE